MRLLVYPIRNDAHLVVDANFDVLCDTQSAEIASRIAAALNATRLLADHQLGECVAGFGRFILDESDSPVARLQWEYKCIETELYGDRIADIDGMRIDPMGLTRQGIDGWELCGLMPYRNSIAAFFKRPLALHSDVISTTTAQ